MNNSRLNDREPDPESSRQGSRDLLVDLDLTPPASPQTSRIRQNSGLDQSSMWSNSSHSSHRGHQSLDSGRNDWRSTQVTGALGSLSLGDGSTSITWGAPNSQRNPRYAQWRQELAPIEGYRPSMVRANGHAAIATPLTSGPYAYCLDRGNGQVTRLIPADMLPPLQEIPRQEPARFGLSVLSAPMAPAPRGIPPTDQSVTVVSVVVSRSFTSQITTTD